MTQFRPDGRSLDQLREIRIQTDIAPHATGSVLISFGKTQVICAAALEKKVPRWMQQQGVEGGWVSAEYSMLPYSTMPRKDRDIRKGKQDGRSIEIQRLIGRSLRAVCDLTKLPGHTLWIDCDVLQADGGTRTASITGAYIAAEIAVQRIIAMGDLKESPFREAVAAISVGIYNNKEVLDLCYLEDRDATVDANIVMTESSKFVEVQSSGEEAVFDGNQLTNMLALAKKGVTEIIQIQNDAIKKALV